MSSYSTYLPKPVNVIRICQEGQHYCLLQRGQGREIPRGLTSPVLRPLGLLCVSRAAGPRGAGPHQGSRGGGGTWAETVPSRLNL